MHEHAPQRRLHGIPATRGKACDHACQHVAGTGGAQPVAAAGMDPQATVRRGDPGGGSLEHQHAARAPRERARQRLRFLLDPARWPDMASAAGRFTAVAGTELVHRYDV